MKNQEEVTNFHDRLPFHIDHLMPPFSTHPHDGLTKIMFASIVGLLLGGVIFSVYAFFVW